LLVEDAVLRTIIYADLFDFPLKKREIWQRLIWPRRDWCQKRAFNQALADLKKRGRLIEKKGFWFLPGREKIIDLRKEREKEAGRKTVKAKRLVRLLKLFPSVKLVGLTGSAAAGNARRTDDIDLLIITSSGWLWFTRFLVTALFSLLGRRRRPGDKNYADKICLNLFLDEAGLDYFSREPNLFLAYELIQLKPLWERGGSYQNLLSANPWVKEFLPNAKKIKKRGQREDGKSRFNPFEWLFYQFQLWWMRKRRTKEIVAPHIIAFHPRTQASRVLSRFNRRVSKENLTLDISFRTD